MTSRRDAATSSERARLLDNDVTSQVTYTSCDDVSARLPVTNMTSVNDCDASFPVSAADGGLTKGVASDDKCDVTDDVRDIPVVRVMVVVTVAFLFYCVAYGPTDPMSVRNIVVFNYPRFASPLFTFCLNDCVPCLPDWLPDLLSACLACLPAYLNYCWYRQSHVWSVRF